MTSKIVVNNIQADAGVSTVTFGSNISGNFVGSISVSGVTTVAAGSASAPSITPTGDSNTGIFFPSADTIAFAEGGVEAARFDSSGQLGIGTASVNFSQFGSNTGGVAIADIGVTNTGLKISDGIYHNYLVQAGNSNLYLSHYGSSGDIIFGTGSSGEERSRITSTGDVQIANGNLVIGTSGKGIDFSATSQAGGMTSELLADYEEGTWTPTWVPSVGSITNSYGSGKYIKIGDMVTLWGYYGYSTSSGVSAGDTIKLGGFPFSTPSSTFGQAQTGIALVHAQYGWNTVPEQTVQLPASSTSTDSLLIKNSTYGPAGTYLTFAAFQTTTNYSQLVFWASYRAT